MSDPKDSRLTRRDTLRLASAAGALGAGLGITLTARPALAIDKYNHKIAAADVGTMGLKISYVGPDGSVQLLSALDISAFFQKVQSVDGAALNIQVGSRKDKWVALFDHSVSVTKLK
jgi:hypothetical protein